MRLDKFLVECGVGSRSTVKQLLKKKRVTVNGVLVTSPKVHVDEIADQIMCDGERLHYESFVYYLLNKPQGVLSATEDAYQPTVLELLDETARRKEVFPVGRLDKDTRGLLLLTNNGSLAHTLLSPKRHVDKVYIALVEGIMTAEDVALFAEGISLKDHQCLPAQLEIVQVMNEDSRCQVRVTLQEGKFHQVKRMVEACGKKVLELQRVQMGPLQLDSSLAEGTFRRLTLDEVESLLSLM